MSSPVLAMIPSAATTSSAAAASGNKESGNSATSAAGLFMSLLNSNASFALSANKGANGNGVSQFGKSGLTLDPALLVLPQELSNMSMEDLQALLAQATQGEDGALSDALLVALTPGTPAAEAINNFLSQHADKAKVIDLSAAAGTTALTASENTLSGDSSLLLIATGISPSELDRLKEALKGLSADAATLADGIASDEDAAATRDAMTQDANALALVMLVPTASLAQQQTITTDGNSDFDLLSFSNLTGSGLYASADEMAAAQSAAAKTTQTSGKADGKYISPFLSDSLLGAGADMTDEEILAGLQQQGFQGSIASLDPESVANTDTLNGKLDSGLLGNSLTSPAHGKLSLFSESAMILPNGQLAPDTGSPITNPVTSHASATSSHPATQTVALLIEKAAASGKNEQTLSLQLDPPELGRVQVQLSLEKGETLKVHVVAENKDTLSLLQRDSHTLRAALDQAGIQTDGSSLSFDLASGDQSFNQMLGGSQSDANSSSGNSSRFSLDATELGLPENIMEQIETNLGFIPDKATGNVHYSLLV